MQVSVRCVWPHEVVTRPHFLHTPPCAASRVGPHTSPQTSSPSFPPHPHCSPVQRCRDPHHVARPQLRQRLNQRHLLRRGQHPASKGGDGGESGPPRGPPACLLAEPACPSGSPLPQHPAPHPLAPPALRPPCPRPLAQCGLPATEATGPSLSKRAPCTQPPAPCNPALPTRCGCSRARESAPALRAAGVCRRERPRPAPLAPSPPGGEEGGGVGGTGWGGVGRGVLGWSMHCQHRAHHHRRARLAGGVRVRACG
jgi:hypothetical protein